VTLPSYAHRSMSNPGVAEFLAKVRKLHGLTQAEAARRARISVGMLSMLENGKRRPSVVVATSLANVYGIPDVARGLLMDEALPGVGKDWRRPSP
jgi:transcriptional regulator with XRE-family HTH domain